MTLDEMNEVLSNVFYPGYTFTIMNAGEHCYLQAHYEDIDITTRQPSIQSTRKWLLSEHMVKSEIVQTAFKCVITSAEHRVREFFRYRGQRIFGPHFDVDALYELAKTKRLDYRKDKPSTMTTSTTAATRKVFLGGTCNNSQWREELIPLLQIDHFNPVVENWTEEFQQLEIEERKNADYVLYVLTPKMTGVYAVAEVVDDSNKRPGKTVLCVLSSYDGQLFSEHQKKSLEAVSRMVAGNGGYVAADLKDIARYLNSGGATSAQHATS